MFGGGLVWFYRDLAGMNYDASAGGYRHIIFAPIIPYKLTSASYSKVTPYGLAGIKWQRVGNTISFEVTVPVGSTASVNFPGKSVQSVTKGLTPKCSGDVVTCDVPQGTYTFVVAQ
jgi:alpha-L-rhamnosidase